VRQLAALDPAAESRAVVESSAYLKTGNAGRLATKALFVFLQKTKMLAGLLVAATLAVAPGVALAHGGGGGSHGGGGFAHHGLVSDRSFRFGRGFRDDDDRFFARRFRHDDDRFFGRRFVFGNPWPGYYDPYYLRAYDDYTVAVQRVLAQLGYYHGPVDGVVGPQTEKAIRWFQSVDRLPVTGEIDSATLRALRIV
jgi:Putative peptidoglycan binding domain